MWLICHFFNIQLFEDKVTQIPDFVILNELKYLKIRTNRNLEILRIAQNDNFE